MKKMKNGFTLIELLVVVLIIGVLAAVALPQYTKTVARSRMANLISLASSLAQAEQRYQLANGEYTVDIADLDIDLPADCKDSALTSSLNSYQCENIFFTLYKGGSGGSWRVQVSDKRIPSWVLWGFDPKDYRYCGVTKGSSKEAQGKAICSSYGVEVPKASNDFSYYKLYN